MARMQVFKAETEGFTQLLDRLKVLPDKLQGRILVDATMGGAEVLREFQESLAPRGEGQPHAAEFIQASRNEGRDTDTKVEVHVGPTGPGFYLTFHETGTLYLAAQPFMRPAAQAAEGEVFRTVADDLRRQLVGAARRRV